MMLSVLSFAASLLIFSAQVVCDNGISSLGDSNNQTREEDISEELEEGSSYTEVEEIFLDAQLMQLQKENLNTKQSLETQNRQLENTRKINQQLTGDKKEFMEKNQQLMTENIRQSSQIGELQRNLQSTQATLYVLQPKLTLIQNNLTITLQNLENATVYARNVESMLETELQMKSTHQEEAILERQMHQITKQTLEDLQSFSKFVMNLTKIQNVRILQLENVTKSMDSTMDQMKEKEKAYMEENAAYQSEIVIQQTATSIERDQKEKLKIALKQQSQLGKTKERMLRVLRNALADMTISIPNCTSLATQAQQSQINAHLEKEDPMKLIISQCNLFNSSLINIQDTYVQMNTKLKGQLEIKNDIINHQANENKELLKSLEERKQLANIQSESLQLLTAEVDILIPNDLTRTRVRRNLDGTIKSANLCQCIPEAPGASRLELNSIQLTCPHDMTILGKDSKIDQIFSLPCSGSACSVEKSSWPQCEDILQKAWTPWVYVNCSQIAIGNLTIQCGSGKRSRTREVRSSSKDPWRLEAVSDPCQQCSISQGYGVTILPHALHALLHALPHAQGKGGIAILSSQFGNNSGPLKCLDGNADTLCHSSKEDNPYFMMEYPTPVSVIEVKVQARNNVNAIRVKNVVVTVTDTKPRKGTLVSGTQLGSKFIGPASKGQWISFTSGSVIKGKYVVVQQQYKGYLNFAEVEVKLGCPDGWSQFQNSCYSMFKTAKTRSSALDHCRSFTFGQMSVLTAELASIHSKEENNFLFDMAKSISSTYIHIGGSDERIEGKWEWSDGSNWTYQNWRSGQPDGGTTQNALLMDKANGQWRDWEMPTTHAYVCKVVL